LIEDTDEYNKKRPITALTGIQIEDLHDAILEG
jgi:hypothetical protein